jgi:hypothetical protein
MVQMVVHSPDSEVDRVLVVAKEVKPRVVEAELHKVQSAQKRSLVQAEMDQTLQASEQSAQRMGPHSVGNRFHLASTMPHNYGKYDTDYS